MRLSKGAQPTLRSSVVTGDRALVDERVGSLSRPQLLILSCTNTPYPPVLTARTANNTLTHTHIDSLTNKQTNHKHTHTHTHTHTQIDTLTD